MNRTTDQREALIRTEDKAMSMNVMNPNRPKAGTTPAMRRVGSFFMSLAFATAVMFSTGCATRTQNGALIGTGVGAGLGAIIGHQSGHAGEGAVIGGLAGALTGGLIGNATDHSR